MNLALESRPPTGRTPCAMTTTAVARIMIDSVAGFNRAAAKIDRVTSIAVARVRSEHLFAQLRKDFGDLVQHIVAIGAAEFVDICPVPAFMAIIDRLMRG